MKHEQQQYESINGIAEKLKQNLYPYPTIIEIHPTDVCNQRCDYCFHEGIGFGKIKLKKPILSIEQYKELFEEMHNSGIEHLSIAGGGEPFLDERMPHLLKMAHQNELQTRIVTNGNFLTYQSMKELMYCDEIRFSIDAIHPETYASIRHVPEFVFMQTMENIRNLSDLRKEHSSQLSMGTTFLVTEKNYLEAEEFCKSMLKLGLDSIVFKSDIYGERIPLEELKKVENSIRELGSPKVEIRTGSPSDIKDMKCFIPYFKIATNSHGDVYSCCLGSQPRETNGYLFGNLHAMSFREIWQTAKPLVRGISTNGVACVNCNYTDNKINKIMIGLMK